MRQSAWLDSIPDAPEQPKALANTERKVTDEERPSRRKKLADEGRPIPLPDIFTPYLPDILFDVGPTMHAGMGSRPLTSSDLLAWQQETGVRLQPWESRMLRRLSRDYLLASHLAEKQGAPPPWTPGADQIDRPAIAKKIKGLFR